MKKQSRHQSVLKRLRGDMKAVVADPTEPYVNPVEPPAAVPARRAPPPGGWPDDEGWREEADVLQGLSGEEPQA